MPFFDCFYRSRTSAIPEDERRLYSIWQTTTRNGVSLVATDRRTFLRHTIAVGAVSGVGGLTGCTAPDIDPPNAGDDSNGDLPSPAPSNLRLQTGMEIGMGFTGFGGLVAPSEVDADKPDGGRLITVGALDPGEQVTVSWRETVEREITPTGTRDAGVGTQTPTPETEIVERTGTLTASGLAAAHASFLPMFWDPGETTTETSAMWLSREALQELTETRQTAWSPDVLTRIAWVGKEVQERIHSAVENVDEEEVVLEAEADFVNFELTVNRQRTSVKAIKAHDSFGNEYIIVANDANPLVVKFTYNAVSTGVSGFDTGLWSLIKAVYSGYQVVSLDAP